ncbi:MAG: hypothetical protein ACERKZ_18145 [Lachnotalea sp.]
MLFIISIVSSLSFFLLFYKSIKKFCGLFYLLTVFTVIYLFGSYQLNIYHWWPDWFMNYFVVQFSRGSLSTAVFAIVMYLGVLNKKIPGVLHLKSIRGEISIIGCILALGHNTYYGIYYFKHLFTNTNELAPPYIIASCITLVLIAIMLPLMITSFRFVRRKMKASNWKKLQRLSYLFYLLLYVHVMIVLSSNIRGFSSVLSIVIYSLVFLPYYVLRIRKYYKDNGAAKHIRANAITAQTR